MALWALPHVLALLETLLLGSSKRLAPFALTLKVALPHSLLAMLTSYLVNGPTFNPVPSELDLTRAYACIAIFVGSHLIRFLLHLVRRSSTPYDFSYEHAALEVVAWISFYFMLQMWLIGAVFVTCTIWKHYIYWRIRSDNS